MDNIFLPNMTSPVPGCYLCATVYKQIKILKRKMMFFLIVYLLLCKICVE